MPSTDGWEGNDTTALGLRDAIEKGAPFYCHEGMEIVNGEYDPMTAKELRLCGGWAVVQSDPTVRQAFVRAALKVGRP